MEVALVGDYPLNLECLRGGPQAVLDALLQGLRDYADLNLHLITASRALKRPQVFRRNRVKFHCLPLPRVPMLAAFAFLCRSIRGTLFRIGPDLVHGLSADVLGAIVLSAGFPAVLTPHSVLGTEVRFAPGRIHRVNLSIQHRLIRHYLLPRVRHIVSISPYIREAYAPHVNATFHDIENPVSEPFFHLDPNRELPGRILFTGRLRSVKRPDLALEAFYSAWKQMPGLQLTFAGESMNRRLENQLHAFVGDKRMIGHVTFAGQLPQGRLLQAYQEMSCLLLTSELESSPMAVEQSMAAGKPSVCTMVGGLPHLVQQGKTGVLVEPGDATGLSRALLVMLRDPKLRRDIGMRAREEALQRFRTATAAKKTRDMYRLILSGASN